LNEQHHIIVTTYLRFFEPALHENVIENMGESLQLCLAVDNTIDFFNSKDALERGRLKRTQSFTPPCDCGMPNGLVGSPCAQTNLLTCANTDIQREQR